MGPSFHRRLCFIPIGGQLCVELTQPSKEKKYPWQGKDVYVTVTENNGLCGIEDYLELCEFKPTTNEVLNNHQ